MRMPYFFPLAEEDHDQFGKVADGDGDILEAGATEAVEDALEDGLLADGQEGFREDRGVGVKALALAACEDHGAGAAHRV
jgi:hypothetical protein